MLARRGARGDNVEIDAYYDVCRNRTFFMELSGLQTRTPDPYEDRDRAE